MRVLAVAQVADLGRGHDQPRRRQRRRLAGGHAALVVADRIEHLGDGRVVGGRVCQRAPRQVEAHRLGGAGAIERLEHRTVIGRVDHDDDVAEVLGRRPHHARPADVDVLDELIEGGGRVGGGLRERVEVHGHQVDEADAVGTCRLEVVRLVPARQDAPVYQGVERLDAAIHHLGEAGHVRDVGHRQAGGRQCGGRAAGRDELEATGLQPAGEVEEAGLVRDTEKCTSHGREPWSFV